MVERKTVLIVGAGASNECDFPTGHELKGRIAQLLDIRFKDGYSVSSGDALIFEALRIVVQRAFVNLNDINTYLAAARQIHSAMPQAISIDNYIDTHQGNKKLELCGKLAIVRAILDSEQQSKMYVDPRYANRSPNYDALDGSWFAAFMQLLTENCRVDGLEARLRSITLVVFNYDRCIEQYIYHWLQTYYGISAEQAEALSNLIEIFHPYGTVGRLPWQSGANTMEFGGDPNAVKLLELAAQIRTFTEGTDPGSSEILSIRTRITEAEIVLFLGFAYHRLNLKLLRTGNAHPDPSRVRYFGTAVGISDSDRDQVRVELTEIASVNANSVNLRSDLTCSRIFREYWRTLSSST